MKNRYISLPLLRLNPRRRGSPGTISVKFSVNVMDGQRTKWRRKIAENFNRLSRAHERHRQTTDDSRTGDSIANVGCADRAQILPWPAPNIRHTTFQISSKSVHFRRSYSRAREGRSLGPLMGIQYSPEPMHRFGRIIKRCNKLVT